MILSCFISRIREKVIKSLWWEFDGLKYFYWLHWFCLVYVRTSLVHTLFPEQFARPSIHFFVCRCLSQATVTTTTSSNNWERNHFPVAILQVYLTKTRFCQIEERLYKWTVLLISSEKKQTGPISFENETTKQRKCSLKNVSPHYNYFPQQTQPYPI